MLQEAMDHRKRKHLHWKHVCPQHSLRKPSSAWCPEAPCTRLWGGSAPPEPRPRMPRRGPRLRRRRPLPVPGACGQRAWNEAKQHVIWLPLWGKARKHGESWGESRKPIPHHHACAQWKRKRKQPRRKRKLLVLGGPRGKRRAAGKPWLGARRKVGGRRRRQGGGGQTQSRLAGERAVIDRRQKRSSTTHPDISHEHEDIEATPPQLGTLQKLMRWG